MTDGRRTDDLAILQQLQDAAHRRAAAAPAPADAAEYDWTCPHRFTEAQRGRIDAFARQAAERLSEALAALLRTQTAFAPDPVAQRYASAVADTDAPVYRVPLHDAAGERCGMAQLPVTQARGWVETLLGGAAATDDEERKLSSLESDLLLDLVSAVVQSLASVSRETGGPDLRRGEAVMADAEPLDTPCGDEFCQLTFKATGDEASDEVTVFLRSELLDPIAGRTGAGGETPGPEQTRARLLDHLGNAPVEVAARLGAARISVRDLMSLEPGDVIILGTGASEPIAVAVEGQVAMRGAPASYHGHYAVQVMDPRDYPRLGLRT